MCAVETFRAAKRVGARCILDAAACHYAEQDRVLFPENPEFSDAEIRLRGRKRTELDLADLIYAALNSPGGHIWRLAYRVLGLWLTHRVPTLTCSDPVTIVIDQPDVLAGAAVGLLSLALARETHFPQPFPGCVLRLETFGSVPLDINLKPALAPGAKKCVKFQRSHR
jgi:hypothetical protein